MINLIKSDFKRILGDKLLIVVAIVGLALAVIGPVMYETLFSLVAMTEEDQAMMEMMGVGLTAKSLYFTALLPGDNLGLIAPILISIILCKDFSYGTIRNKIISGKPRWMIFISSFIACSAVLLSVMLVYALITFFVALIFFPYSDENFSMGELGYFLASTAMKLLVFLFVSALICTISSLSKNVGLSIVLFVAISFIFAIVGSVSAIGVGFADPNSSAYFFLEFITNTNPFSSSLVGSGTSYEITDLLYAILSPVILTVGVLLLGVWSFNKKDIK